MKLWFNFYTMTYVGFLILFVLNCGLFCEGQVIPPSNKTNITVLPGSTARLKWTFTGDVSRASLFWYFTRNGGSEEEIAVKFPNQPVIISNSSLVPGVAIENSLTLVLKNVDESFNGRYQLNVAAIGGGVADVYLLVAAKPSVTINCSDPTTVNESANVICLCKSQGGVPPNNVTWYDKDDVQIGNTSYGENILTITKVTQRDTGRYICKAQSFTLIDEKSFELIVHYKPINTKITVLKEAYISEKLEIACDSDGLPAPTFTITHNVTMIVSKKATYTKDVQYSDAGIYACVANNKLGNDTDSGSLIIKGKSPPAPTTPNQKISSTMYANKTADKTSCNCPKCRTEWYIIVVTLVSGIIIGLFLAFIIWCLHRRQVVRSKNAERNPEPQATKVYPTYQELDLSKMNTEDNYESLRVNAATNEDDSTYTTLSKTREEENNYQSLT